MSCGPSSGTLHKEPFTNADNQTACVFCVRSLLGLGVNFFCTASWIVAQRPGFRAACSPICVSPGESCVPHDARTAQRPRLRCYDHLRTRSQIIKSGQSAHNPLDTAADQRFLSNADSVDLVVRVFVWPTGYRMGVVSVCFCRPKHYSIHRPHTPSARVRAFWRAFA